MPRGSSRKYKRYKVENPKDQKDDKPKQNQSSERLRYFGDMQPRREDGLIDLTPYNAAIGQELISTVRYDIARHVVKRRGRPLKQRALDR